jgi:uncharacterized repeat protein (TIGR01451 family)
MPVEHLTGRTSRRHWLLVALSIGLALAVALSMALAGDAEAKKKKKRGGGNKARSAVPAPTPETCQTFPGGQLCLDQTVSPNKGKVGNLVTFTVVETNRLNFTTFDAIVDTLPPGVEFVSATQSPGGTCTNNAGTVTCPNGTFAPGQTLTAKIVVRTTKAGKFTNRAETFFDRIPTSEQFTVDKKKKKKKNNKRR